MKRQAILSLRMFHLNSSYDCTKITLKEDAIMMASKNDQVCKVSHIILHIRHTSHGNTTQLDKRSYQDAQM